ncbi:unnamed protein product [Blepharisma stoltei]|uniref:Tyrosine-protein kinase ephrin type A/B receptor-like domain-containing protein n=1 Tax=Blepharisma stoltei TaxID=1481888 RepID=A0AAU9J3A2_9CILI|nr:unnamed protein product [Blepharisma stoltei]
MEQITVFLCKNLLRLNTTTWTWNNLTTGHPPKLEGPALNYHNKKLYLAGGYAPYLENPYTHTFFYYDLVSNKWVNATSEKTYTPRIHHGHFIYKDQLFLMSGYNLLTNSIDNSWYKVNLTDPSYNWVKVEIIDNDYYTWHDSYGFALFEDKIFTFGGNKISDITNRLSIYNLKTDPIDMYALSENVSPSPRMYHSFQEIGQYLYTFGGIGDNGELLNDLWRFDTINESWEIKLPNGDIPSKRHSYASASDGDHMLIWGGKGQEGYLNDGYFYNINTNMWYPLVFSGTNPSPRVGACIGLKGETVYLYGGEADAGLSDEFWYYSIDTQTYTLLDSDNLNGPGPLIYPTCKLSATTATLFYIMYGESDDNFSTNKIYGYTVNTGRWTKYYDESTDTLHKKSRAAILKVPSMVLMAGGESDGIYPDIIIYTYGTKTGQWEDLGFMLFSVIGPASTYFKNYFYIHGGATAERALLRFSVPSNKFIRMDLGALCTSEECPFTCSPGTYITSSGCEICPPGTYSQDFGQFKCMLCPRGKYNPHSAATTGDMCYPCQQGQFSNKEGQRLCNDCPFGAACNIGSLNYEFKILNLNDSSIQPSLYKSNQSQVNENNMITGIVVGSFGAIIIVLLVAIKRNRVYLLAWDLYTEEHNYLERTLMYIRRTRVGGIFGIAFIFVAIAIIEILIVNYLKKNEYETKSLVPLVVLKQDVPNFEGDFYITITLMNYGGICANIDNYNNIVCPSSISYKIEGITGSWEEQHCMHMENGDCIIKINCAKCSIDTQGYVYYTMDDSNGYTSGFIVNVTSSSSIPDKSSSYKTAVLPENNYVFIGGTTTIYYDMIPSYYEDTIYNKDDTGYHVEVKNIPDKGLQYQSIELGNAFINYLTLELDLDGNGLVTSKGAKQTFINLISALLGSVIAVLKILGTAMGTTEDSWHQIKKTSVHRKLVKETKRNAENIHSSYGKWQKNGYDDAMSSEGMEELDFNYEK